jgi:1-acyl-sn-glycerol-3-phosphate acyltransferase
VSRAPDSLSAHHFHPHPESHRTLRILRAANRVFARTYHHLTVLSPLTLPKTGPAILISNHTSGLDPLLIQSVSMRIIVWMMAREYYEIPGLNRLFRILEIIPVDRGARDSGAMRLALRALQEGRILGLFPEGRIETAQELLPFQPGVAQMAIKLKVPVHPAFLDGTQHGLPNMIPAVLNRQRATVRFGPPIEFDRSSTTQEGLAAATETLRQAMLALRAGSRWPQ